MTNALDTNGNATGVTLAVSSPFLGANTYNNSASFAPTDVVNDYWWLATNYYIGGNYADYASLTLSGLGSEAAISVDLVSYMYLTGDHRKVQVRVGGGAWVEANAASPSTSYLATGTTAVDGTAIIEFRTPATGAGIADGSETAPGGRYWGYINGMTVETVIPEPATMSLLALGGLAMLRRRR